ncbi:serine-threonine kinase [Baekduia alba]|uniref:serine/threonine-protein kinase n=1 Tax=Baekduia alba TaxID=2997333 RepID=UPI00234169FE|nr:serine/threonine-protein kinase [Baekduia alba]WCB91340.1 serine-threonine kinase [Baekduia alba]
METAEHPTTTTASGSDEVVLDRYRLVRRLGGGGFGVVWLAHDLKLDRTVAVKRIPAPDADTAKRAQREGVAAARLQHPAIVALHEAGSDDENVYLVSELVRGATFARLLEEGALSDRDVVEIGVALCDALAHAHKRGIIHRDVKPLNILVPDTAGDGGAPAKLTDFGVARIAGDDALTRTGDVVGTLAYMAPEQAEGAEVGAEADLYALGLCLYEGLSGVNPLRARGAGATARRIGQRLPPLGRLRRDLPLDLCAAIDLAVWPHPDERGTLTDLRAALAVALEDVDDEPGTIAGGPLEPLAPVAPPHRTKLAERALAAALAAAIAGAALKWGATGELSTAVEHAAGAGGDAAGGAAAGAGGDVAHGAATAASAATAVPPVAPLTGALAVAVATLLLPRVAWIAMAAVLTVWLAGVAPDRAWLVGAVVLPVPLLLRRSAPATWSVPAVAPLLALGTVSGAYPALAGRVGNVWTRAAAGALGAWCVLLAEPLLHRTLVVGAPGNTGGTDAVAAVATAPAVALVGLWAAAAAVLPLVVRGRILALDIVVACGWAAGLAAASQAAIGSAPRGLIVGAIAAAALAVAPRASLRVREPR